MTKQKVSIIGLGLIGGSIGLALKDTGRFLVSGFDTDPKSLNIAFKIGAINQNMKTLSEIHDSDIVFIATPISETVNTLKKIAPLVKAGTIVTDVASVKTEIVKSCPKNITFVGGHPMAGKETAGITEAQKDLFVNRKWILTSKNHALEQIISLMGAKPKIMDVKTHDQSVAAISHLPFIVSSILFSSTGIGLNIAASGFKDTTRLASGNPTLHTDIVIANKKNILKQLDCFTSELNKIRDLIEIGNITNIGKFFVDNKIKRDRWLKEENL